MTTSYLTPEQFDILMRPIHPKRVLGRTENGKTLSYVEAHDIKAEMIRVYGFNRFSWRITEVVCLYERETKTKAGKDAWAVGYRVTGELTVCAPDGTVLAVYDGAHAGSSIHPDLGEAHGNALANADSYAFKRAALYPLGTQGGLGLYNKGDKSEIVRWTLVKPERPDGEKSALPDPDDVPQVQPESEQAEPAAPAGETNTPEPPDPGEQQRQTKADALRDQIIAAKDGKALRDLAPQMRGVQTEVVADADGKPVVLAALLKRRLAELSGVAA